MSIAVDGGELLRPTDRAHVVAEVAAAQKLDDSVELRVDGQPMMH
jgi:hypothetical protein